MARLVLHATLAAAVALGAGGCYGPHVADCAYACNSTPDCPDSTTCDVGRHACRTSDSTGACGAAADAAPTDTRVAEGLGPIDAVTDSPTDAPWRIVQTNGNDTGVIAVMPTLEGSTLIVAGQFGNTGLLDVSDDAGNKYVRIDNSTAIFDGPGSPGVELWFASAAHGHATKITATGPATASPFPAVAWEVAGLGGPTDSMPVAAVLSGQAATLDPTSPPLTATRFGELIITGTDFETGLENLSVGFTEDSVVDGDGWAHLTSPVSPPGTYQATWRLGTPGRYCATAAAFVVGP